MALCRLWSKSTKVSAGQICDQLAGTLEQHRKNEQWLSLKSLPDAAFAELKRAGVQLKNVKTQQGRGLRRSGHG